MRKVVDVPSDVRRWTAKPPDVEDARADLQRAMGKLAFAHAARLARAGEDPKQAADLCIIDMLEAVCAAANAIGWDPQGLVVDFQLVIDRFVAGEVTP